ncbi:MAG: cytochrome c biogenesis protein CcsA [Elusimicrobia bacterium]|nr:cytochrome c biogenesis protein CcsA [Elusimicrobiota bacterium]
MSRRSSVALPAVITAVAAAAALWGIQPAFPDSAYDLETFVSLPVLNGGRVKPVDSVARNALLLISGRQSVRANGGTESAEAWFLDMVFAPSKCDDQPIFEIDNPDVLGLMGIEQTNRRRFSERELEPHFREIEQQARRSDQMKPSDRGRFESAINNLYNKIELYQKLQNTIEPAGTEHAVHEVDTLEARMPALMNHAESMPTDKALLHDASMLLEKYQFLSRAAAFFPLPRKAGVEVQWLSPGQAGLVRMSGGELHPGLNSLAAMGDAYRKSDITAFNAALRGLADDVREIAPHACERVQREVLFNFAEPFYRAMLIYLAAFLLVVSSWLAWPQHLRRSAVWLIGLAFVIHTAGLVTRMAIQGRPPVTNLYSSAIFVGWTAVLLGLIVERVYKNGVAAVAASLIGFSTLIIAHHLAAEGDTLEMMRAVLDSNFWLATHVVAITIGYSSTFLSWFLGIVYVARRLWRSGGERLPLERMVYGVVCFSTFFSFVGTILGGIWADQSWGRFWGWDPKENGALMIVLWNAFILHARWGRAVSQRAVIAMAVFGNIVTALSWFGVNMLGIGLHSYGFMDKAFFWLLLFCASQLVVIGLAYVPAGAAGRLAGETFRRQDRSNQ